MHKSCSQKVLYNIQGNLTVNDKLLGSSISGNDAYLDDRMGSVYINENNNAYRQIDDYNSEKYKGKGVVLVDSDNPWYLNDDESIPWPTQRIQTKGESINVKEVVVIDNKPKQAEEKDDEKSQINIIFILIIIFVILILFKIGKNN